MEANLQQAKAKGRSHFREDDRVKGLEMFPQGSAGPGRPGSPVETLAQWGRMPGGARALEMLFGMGEES